jgi:hypothetical protein
MRLGVPLSFRVGGRRGVGHRRRRAIVVGVGMAEGGDIIFFFIFRVVVVINDHNHHNHHHLDLCRTSPCSVSDRRRPKKPSYET